MTQFDVKILDCTLRDGGYINDWNWGYDSAKDIIFSLVKAGVEVIEVGFLRDIDTYNPDITVCSSIENLNKLLPVKKENVIFSAMAMRSNYNIDLLSPYSGEGIELIRVTSHDYDLMEGLEFARKVKEKGYKVSINPINIKGYSDQELLKIFTMVNDIHPYQFSVVDTFGSMKRRDMERIIRMADNNLLNDIRLGLHLHENMSLSCYLSQDFVDMHLTRPITVDGSLMGMGRTPGNLPIELIADYLNDYTYKTYDIDYMLDAIQDYIKRYKGESNWGYSIEYFLSARFNIHRNYAEHLLKKGDLTCKDINHILSQVERKKSTVFDVNYIDEIYNSYKKNKINDIQDYDELEKLLQNKEILIIAPGSSINKFEEEINKFIRNKLPIVISLNFIPNEFYVDYAFFSNKKRIQYIENVLNKTIITSNLTSMKGDYIIDYNRVAGDFNVGVNSLILLLRLLKSLSVSAIYVAGADGYSKTKDNYFSTRYKSNIEWDDKYNKEVAQAIHKIGIKPVFITPSAYDSKE